MLVIGGTAELYHRATGGASTSLTSESDQCRAVLLTEETPSDIHPALRYPKKKIMFVLMDLAHAE